MQGVMNASATQSGTLLTPLMFGMVTGSFLGGQLTYRLRKYKAQGVTGSILVAAGMAFFAQMNGATPRVDIIYGMVLAGVGMGLIQTTYTVAVQNAAPRRQMGAATASTMFFRSVGSTLGVAVFGSVLLTSYHRDFAKGVPPGTSPDALQYFTNPLLLVQMRPQLESIFSRTAGGLDLMRLLMVNVRGALTHGLHMIFVSSAVLMTAAIALNLLLKNVPLRSHQGPAPAEPPAH
jgi:MFS family permease